MNRTYAIHYGDYAVGENEALYARMARRGWQLKKRGAYLSRFSRAEPAAMCYRIELAAPGWLEDVELPDEQIAIYEDCGWRFICRRGLVNVFSAPEGSGAPEFYSDPRQQAATLKALRRQCRNGWLALLLILAVHFLLAAMFAGGTDAVLRDFVSGFWIAWVEATAVMAGWLALLAVTLYSELHSTVCTYRLYRRLRRGQPIDHAPKGRMQVHRTVTGVLLASFLVAAALAAWQWARLEEYALPQTADGPYLLLEDLGLNGERDVPYVLDRSSTVKVSQSLAARCYDVYECLEAPDGTNYWMFQDVYVLESETLAQRLTTALMDNATFADSRAEFEPVYAPDMDAVWNCGMEYIARRGNYVCTLTLNFDTSDPVLGETVAAALASRWSQQ